MYNKIKTKDLLAIANGIFSSIEGVKNNSKQRIKYKMLKIFDHYNLVSRDEFNELKAIAIKAREENDKLLKKVRLLENKLKKL